MIKDLFCIFVLIPLCIAAIAICELVEAGDGP